MQADKFKALLRNQVSEIKHCLSLAKNSDSTQLLFSNLRELTKMAQRDEESIEGYTRRIKAMNYPKELQRIHDYCLELYEQQRKK